LLKNVETFLPKFLRNSFRDAHAPPASVPLTAAEVFLPIAGLQHAPDRFSAAYDQLGLKTSIKKG